jgi:thiol-disulfide isomerase/thioredoxin
MAAAVMLGTATAALAERDRYDVGEAVKNFTLKVVNPEDVGHPYIGIDRFYGPEAKEPKKAILVSFFATYCEPCKREMPYLAALYDTYADKGLMILSVSIDKEAEKIDEVAALAKEARVKFPILSDRFNIVAKRYFIEKLPCVYLVDGAGKVAMVKIGYSDDISRDLLDNIRTAIGEPTSDPVPDALAHHMAGHDGATAPPSSEGAGDAEKTASASAAGEGQEGNAKAVAAESGDQGKKKKKAKRKKRKRKRKKKR